MRLSKTLPLLALCLLSSCAPRMGSDAARMRTLSGLLSGTYSGVGKVGILKNDYRMLLNIDPKTGRADAVITNTSLNKVYPANGTFVPYNDQGGALELNLFEGKRNAGNLKARLMLGGTQGNTVTTVDGNIKTWLLNFQIQWFKGNTSQSVSQGAAVGSSLQVVPLQQTTSTSVSAIATPQVVSSQETSEPVYVTPAPFPQ